MLDHAAEVARIGLEEIGLGGDSVVAAILHDVVRTASRADGIDAASGATYSSEGILGAIQKALAQALA